MEVWIILLAVIGVACIVLGLATCVTAARTKDSKGTIHISFDDPGGPSMFLRLDVPIEDIVSEKRVIFNVDVIR